MERFKQWMIEYTAPAVPRSPALRAASAAIIIVVAGARLGLLAYRRVVRQTRAS